MTPTPDPIGHVAPFLTACAIMMAVAVATVLAFPL
jgi:hypothetical protein